MYGVHLFRQTRRFLCCIDEGLRVETVQYSNCVQLHTCIYNVYTYMYMYAMMVVITVFMHMYKKLIHIHVLMRDERRKEERSKQDQTNNKAKQQRTPHVPMRFLHQHSTYVHVVLTWDRTPIA